MKVKSAVDLWISVIVFGVIGLITGVCFFAPSGIFPVLLLFAALVDIFLLWIYFGTYYILRDDCLTCKSGPLKYTIPYDRIKSIRLSENLLSSMALSRKRIEIREYHKGYFAGTTMISPHNRELFYEKLKEKCRNLED